MLVGIPQYEVLLRQRIPTLEAGDIGVGIFFLAAFLGNLSDRDLKAHLGSKTAIGKYKLLPSSELLPFLGDIAVRDKAQAATELAEIRELFLAPHTAKRGHDIGNAQRLETHHIWCSLDEIDLANLSGGLHGHINAENGGALPVNQTVTAIDVFDGCLRTDTSCRKGLYTSPAISLGNHQTTSVEVVVVAGMRIVFSQQTHLCKNLEIQAFSPGILEEFVAFYRTVAQTECAAELLVPTAGARIG